MKVHCVQEPLTRAHRVCAALGFRFSDGGWVYLTAQEACAEKPEHLDVCAWSASQTIGVVAELPALVEKPGRVCAPAPVVAEALATMHASRITLSLVEVLPPASPQEEELLKVLKSGPALQIEGTSACGAGSTQRIRVRLPFQEGALAAMPAVASWSAAGFPLGEVEPARLRAALAPCLFLAHQRAEPSETAPEMKHALVLLRCDAAHLQWTATTRSAVASQQLPLLSPGPGMPFSHALFDERVLTWISVSLTRVKRPVKLTLVPYGPQQVLLLVEVVREGVRMTLFCLGATEPIPHQWEKRAQQPAATALVVPRVALLHALSFFSTSGEEDGAHRHVLVSVSRNVLCVRWDTGRTKDPFLTAERQIPLENTVEDVSPMLVHLQQMKRFVRALRGPAIRLELGTVVRQGQQAETAEDVAVDWLRFALATDSSSQLVMTTSHYPSPPANASALVAPVAVSEPEQQGVALAPV